VYICIGQGVISVAYIVRLFHKDIKYFNLHRFGRIRNVLNPSFWLLLWLLLQPVQPKSISICYFLNITSLQEKQEKQDIKNKFICLFLIITSSFTCKNNYTIQEQFCSIITTIENSAKTMITLFTIVTYIYNCKVFFLI